MDKENGKSTEGNSSSSNSKLPNPADPATLLDAASLFAYWPRGDANSANAANLFAAAAGGAYGLGPHPGMPFGMLSPAAAAAAAAASGRGHPYPSVSSASAASAAAYNNAYTNTLSVAASQAASLGIPAASAAWWSMASHLAAQDYLVRLQASGLNFPGLGNPSDPYSSLGLPSLGSLHKSSKNSKSSSSLPKSSQSSSKEKNSVSIHPSHKSDGRLEVSIKSGGSLSNSKITSPNTNLPKYSSSGLTIQPSMKLPSSSSSVSVNSDKKSTSSSKMNDLSYLKSLENKISGSSSKSSPQVPPSTSSIFTNPLSLASNMDKSDRNTPTPSQGSTNSIPNVPSSILSAALEGHSDPNSILGGVRLPPDTEIIKYTSSIVGPKIPGTTNRGRKKTISLDPPSVSVLPTHSSTGMLIERSNKRPKLDTSESTTPPAVDRVEVIKLPPTNGSPSGISVPSFSSGNFSESSDGPLNLSLKPTSNSTNHSSSSLNSLSNMSANLGMDRVSRRKPGPKPRKVIQSPSLPPGAPSASLVQLFSSADSPRPPSRSDGSEGSHSTSSNCSASALSAGTTTITTTTTSISSLPAPNHKDGRPRNLGRGVSKPKKNTVASLLAQSRALGIKPMPMIDPNASMSQQMSLLKSNILAAQQFIAESGGDEKTLNKFLQEKLRGTLSDSSTVDASTDSDNLTDSNHTDSEMEVEMAAKKQKQFDERALRVPLERGWKRETIIRGITKNGGIKGDVTYVAPDSANKFKQMSDITQYLDYQKSSELSRENFTFSCRIVLGEYLQPVPPEYAVDGEFLRLTEDDVNRRLEELRAAMRTNLPVEQRIEVARRQQAARAAARMDREQARLAREMERSERQEAARRDREARSQQLLEAKRKRQEEMEKHKQEEQQRKQQERELKRQQTALLKEQERERRRQHMSLVKALENRRKLEERERKKQQLLAEKQANKEKKLEQRRMEMEILSELRKPCEDLELNQTPLPEYERIPGLKLPGKAFADVLMAFEFLHNFGETLGFDMESLPTLENLQQALLYNTDSTSEAEEELLSVMTHLVVCAIEDPGIPNPARHTTILGQSLRQADITHTNLSEILRIYLYANATGEVKALTGVHFERDREKRVADHHQNDCEMQQTQTGKNATYYEHLHDNATWKMADTLKDKPFLSLSPTDKAAILAYLCNELLQNKAVIRQIEGSLDTVAHCKKEKWLLDAKIRKLRMLHNKKVRSEAVEKAQAKLEGEPDAVVDSPALHKDDLLDDEENEMSENESVATQPDEEEDNKLSGEELGKKLEKLLKASEVQLQSLNTSTHQLRATCFGQDRYWRRYWSLPKAGGVFVEAMESADPEVLDEQEVYDRQSDIGIKSVDDIKKIVDDVENQNPNDSTTDKEVRSLVGEQNEEKCEQTNCLDGDKLTDNNANEHRKTPNRLDIIENGDIVDKREHNLDELRKSVDKIVQSLEQGSNGEQEEESQEKKYNHVDSIKVKEEEDEAASTVKKFNLFEKLGECMERENKTEEELKMEVKQEVKDELKNEILNELKSEIKTEVKPEHEEEKNESERWFSILSRDGTCEGVHMTAGNRWDNGVGACTRDNITELKIPVFPPPNSGSSYLPNSCDSPAPLQMTPEESVQLEYIKKHGLPKPCERTGVPLDKRYGWWRIIDTEQLRVVLENLHVRGARERELKRTFVSVMQSMYERQGKLTIEEGCKESTELTGMSGSYEDIRYIVEGAPEPDKLADWNTAVAQRVDTFLLEQVEALEDKVANASMQNKGWRPPSREGELPEGHAVTIAKERLGSLELNIERRYLKPPLGINTGDPNLAAIAQEAAGTTAPPQPIPSPDDIPKGLAVWREAVNRSATSAQLAMCLYTLEASIAWDKSIMKANCQFCNSGDNEDKLLLCDGCDKGYHTYCFKPKMENIPEGDWYCHECMNKATGERNCIVCGKKQSTTSTKLILCEICPRAYHTDCMRPPLAKVPRGKWYCINCISKKPQKKPSRKKDAPKQTRESESSDHPPSSPAPSHSSATTNEDLNHQQNLNSCNQSDISNSSAGSPSGQKKDRGIPKKLLKELAPCKAILEDLECHDDAWPFLLPVNTKQFPTYKKIIKSPMDLSTIKKRLQDVHYKSKEEFCADVRQIFNNCETFNEDDSPVGKAGHCMRQFFEARWNELCMSNS